MLNITLNMMTLVQELDKCQCVMIEYNVPSVNLCVCVIIQGLATVLDCYFKKSVVIRLQPAHWSLVWEVWCP